MKVNIVKTQAKRCLHESDVRILEIPQLVGNASPCVRALHTQSSSTTTMHFFGHLLGTYHRQRKFSQQALSTKYQER